MKRNTYWVIMGLAAALRILLIARAPLWYDENFTLLLARLPFDKMIQATAGDVHPPLWYLIEWMVFHAAPSLPVWAIRIPALICSLLSLNALVLLFETLRIPERARTVALLLMAVMPMQLWYAQEARMYALLEWLVLVALYAGFNKKWIMFALASIALTYTQNYGMIYLAVIGGLVIARDRSSLWQMVTIALITAAAYLPWVFVMANQMTLIEGRYWIMDSSAGAALDALYKQFWASAMMSEGKVASYAVTYAALLLGAWTAAREKQWVALTMAFAPLALAWIVSALWQPILLFRPLIGISPFLYILVSLPVNRQPSIVNRQSLYAACFVIPLVVLGLGGYYKNIAAMKGEGAVSSMLAALEHVRANWREGDVIYYADDGAMINLMPYVGADMPQYKLPECDSVIGYAPVLGSLTPATRSALGMTEIDLADVTYTRAWVFAPRSPLHPLCYEAQIADMAQGAPLVTVDENEFISSGVWLVER